MSPSSAPASRKISSAPIVYPYQVERGASIPDPDHTCPHEDDRDASRPARSRLSASREGGTTPQRTAGLDTAQGAGIGTLIGAGLGAAIGAAAGNPGLGAAVGAGGGLLTGTVFGARKGQAAGSEVQRRFDIAYTQCMDAKGNRVSR